MRLLMLVLMGFLVTSPSVAGPFGLQMGQSLADLRKHSEVTAGERQHIYSMKKAPVSHPDFPELDLIVTPSHGLCKIAAWTGNIKTSAYGTELQTVFTRVQGALSAKYGKAEKTYDFLRVGSIWKEPQDWMMGLLKKERIIGTFWISESEVLPDNLKLIHLDVKALSTDTGEIGLIYEFTNANECLRERDAKKDAAL